MNVIGISGLHNSAPFKRKAWPHLSKREYRIAQGFDSAAALVNHNGIVAAAAEERFSREKGTGTFPVKAIDYCLRVGGIRPAEIDFIAHGFSYGPHRALFHENDHARRQFDEVYAPEVQESYLQQFFPAVDLVEKFVPVPHHVAHAASAFYLSGFDESLILISDGMGEIDSMTVAVGKGNDIDVIRTVPASHSLGILYGVFTLYLGFYMGLDEYKIMGLAPYGDRQRFFNDIMDLIHIKEDGTYTIPELAKNMAQDEAQTHRGMLATLEARLGPMRQHDEEITQDHKDIAAGIQAVLQNCQLQVLRHFKRETGQRNLCLAGGVALNCAVNGAIKRSHLFQNMFVQPAAGDDGTALGAALYAQRLHDPGFKKQTMSVPLWGPEYNDREVLSTLGMQHALESVKYPSFEELCSDVAGRLVGGNVVAWFQGRMEFGARALGNRSILADPRDPQMRDRIDSLVMQHEGFKPFTAAVTKEAASRYFEIREGDEDAFAHTRYVTPVRSEYRDLLPAITHVDRSALVQTVSKEHHPRFWLLLREFEKLSGIPMLLNTSFSVKNQPLVRTPDEAVDAFLFARLDALAIGSFVAWAEAGVQLDRARQDSTERIIGNLV